MSSSSPCGRGSFTWSAYSRNEGFFDDDDDDDEKCRPAFGAVDVMLNDLCADRPPSLWAGP